MANINKMSKESLQSILSYFDSLSEVFLFALASGYLHGVIFDTTTAPQILWTNHQDKIHAILNKKLYNLVTFMIENKCIDDINAQNDNKETLLHQAVIHHNAKLIQLLIDSKADINRRSKWSAIIITATYINNTNIINLLIDNGADLRFCNYLNETPFVMSVRYGNFIIVEKILEHYTPSEQEMKHVTKIAYSYGYPKVLKLLETQKTKKENVIQE